MENGAGPSGGGGGERGVFNQGFIQDFLLGGGKVCSHVSRKRINVGGSGESNADKSFPVGAQG